MKASEEPVGAPEEADGGGMDQLEELVALYLGRLNDGEPVPREEILRDHPGLAAEILRDLDAFVALDRENAVGWPGTTGAGAPGLGLFGRFEILCEIGRGGMGVVYEARDPDMDRRVALKVLPAGLKIHEKSVVRFRREARIVGKLHHPNIVSVYATGVEDRTPYIAMELVEGEGLEKILARKRPRLHEESEGFGSSILTSVRKAFATQETVAVEAPAVPSSSPPCDGRAVDVDAHIPSSTEQMDLTYCIRIARTFAGVAEALQHAHSRGVVHRDMKPSNLILDTAGNLRILDFGLARLEGQDTLTGSGEVLGTPRYMSPEQVRARVEVDHRTDIYSLGATLYEVLTLSPPFHGRSAEETLSHIVHRDPRSPRQLNPRVPRDLETIVLKCLAKDPNERYGTAEALAQDLERFVRGDPIEARPQSFGERLVRRVRRHRGKFAVGAVLTMLIASILWLVYERSVELHRRQVAEYDDQVVSALLMLQTHAFGGQALEFVWSGLGYDVSLLTDDIAWSGDRRVRKATRVLESARSAVPERPEAFYHLARGLLLLGEEQRAFDELAHATRQGFVPSMLLQATLHRRRGELREAERLVARAQESTDGSWAKTWLSAHLAMAEERWSDATAAYGKLIEMEKARRTAYVGASVEIYLGCGLAQLRLERYGEARQNFLIAGALWPGAVEPEFFVGVTYQAQGEEDKAEEVFLDLLRRSPTDEVGTMIVAYYGGHLMRLEQALVWTNRMRPGYFRDLWRITCLSELGRFEESAREAVAFLEKYPPTALSYALAVDAIVDRPSVGLAELAEAEVYVQKLIGLRPRSSVGYSLRALVLLRQGRRDESFMMWKKGAEIEPDSPRAHFSLGEAQKDRGDFEGAIRSIRKALDLARGTRGGLFGSGLVHLILGDTYERAGRADDATATYEQAVALLGEQPRVIATNPNLRGMLGRACFVTGRVTKALRVLEEQDDTRADVAVRIRAQHREYVLTVLPDLPTFRAADVALALSDETVLVERGATWRYFKGVASPSPGLEWTGLDFDDTNWETGVSGFGYGDGDDATVLDDMAQGYTTLYLRHEFELRDVSDHETLLLSVLADDGYVAYLNGEEVVRANVEVASTISHDATATTTAREPIQAVTVPLETEGRLREGTNVLAVVGVNHGLDSSDFSLNPELRSRREHDPERDHGLLERFRQVAQGADAQARLAYLEGRLLQREGRHQAADERLRIAVAGSDDAPEPLLALVESLRALRKPEEAERLLRDALERRCAPGHQRRASGIWDAWLAVTLSDLRRDASARLPEFPCVQGATIPDEHLECLSRLLKRVVAGHALRINCGGPRYESGDGPDWEADRFYTRGYTYMRGSVLFDQEIQGTDDDPLYQSERYFRYGPAVPPAYRVPLPRGLYRVVLHFAEIAELDTSRIFNVLVEGNRVLEHYEPLRSGFATADVKTYEVEVNDGVLDIEFEFLSENPKVSAIEIEPLNR